MTKRLWSFGAAMAALMASTSAFAGASGDLLRNHLYSGTLQQGLAAVTAQATTGESEAALAAGVFNFALGVEEFAQGLYRYGATTPDTSFALLLFGAQGPGNNVPANPDPEPVDYGKFRALLESFVERMDAARSMLEIAGGEGDYVVMLDPLQFRLDLNGDGTAEEAESVGAMLQPLLEFSNVPSPDTPPSGRDKKHPIPELDARIGMDRADAYWLAGYSQVLASQADFLLAHDFEEFVNAYFHRIFPQSGLPMQDFDRGGTLAVDPQTDAAIADVVAAIHTADFPVIDRERMVGVLDRLSAVTDLSRKNWQAILAETDDQRELVPSPSQTSLVPETKVTQETVDAWMATLDTADRILEGTLLVPHWRFKQGIDLKSYFETATETDIVMMLTGYGALPFLKDGPVADAESFAEANRVFGDQFINYALWFN